MKAGYKTIDCDRHVVEPIDMWDNYLEKRFQHYNVQMGGRFTLATRIGGVLQNDDSLGSPGAGMATDPIWRKQFKHGMTHNFEPQAYLEDMDAEGRRSPCAPRHRPLRNVGRHSTLISPPPCAGRTTTAVRLMYTTGATEGRLLLPLQDIELARRGCGGADELGMVGHLLAPKPHMGRLMSYARRPHLRHRQESRSQHLGHEAARTGLPCIRRGG